MIEVPTNLWLSYYNFIYSLFVFQKDPFFHNCIKKLPMLSQHCLLDIELIVHNQLLSLTTRLMVRKEELLIIGLLIRSHKINSRLID